MSTKDPASDHLRESQLEALSIIERACSVFSLLGCIFIIVTFCCSKAFHKPINRLVFYASFGNMMTNVGTLMARTYVSMPNSVGCQFQAFLIQMFMPADAFWTLAMAINVYLTFYYKFDARRLRRMEVPYLLVCYGIPFIPAFTYVFLSNSQGQRVYGNATLWCWVTPEWDIWRIATFYGPVWVVILITFFIYLRAGGDIYQKRKQLHNFSSAEPEQLTDPYGSVKTTEVFVTSEAAEPAKGSIGLGPVGRRGSEANAPQRPPNAAYSVSISANPRESHADIVLPVPSNIASAARPQNLARRRNQELNNAAWSYTKCALLFFTAILVTWIPSSANRVYSVIHTREASSTLEFMSAFVLPLQGFWNAIIYIVTSWKACKTLWSDICYSRRPAVTDLVGGFRSNTDQFKIPSRDRTTHKNYESESMTELASSRPNSNEQRHR